MKRIILAATTSAEEFGKLYDNVASDMEGNWDLLREIDGVLDAYSEGTEDVTIMFDRANKEDKRKLMNLVKSVKKPDSEVISPDAMKKKFRVLRNKYDRDAASEYEYGYYEAMCDMADAYNIELE